MELCASSSVFEASPNNDGAPGDRETTSAPRLHKWELCMCDQCSKIDDMVAKLAGMAEPGLGLFTNVLLRESIRGLNDEKHRIPCERNAVECGELTQVGVIRAN
jgi:hypothetical protein